MNKVDILAFGIAHDILGKRTMQLNTSSTTIGELREELISSYPKFKQLASLSFAVDENYQEDTFTINSGMQVAIIPPVSGG